MKVGILSSGLLYLNCTKSVVLFAVVRQYEDGTATDGQLTLTPKCNQVIL
jgi:hypothetical protein